MPARAGQSSFDVLRASAAKVDFNDKREVEHLRRRLQGWYKEAWAYTRQIPEVQYAHNYVANSMKRIRLFVGAQVEDDEDPSRLTDDVVRELGINPKLVARAEEELARLDTFTDGGLPELQHAMGYNLSVVGDVHVWVKNSDTEDEQWDVLSTSEILVKADDQKIYRKRTPMDSQGELVLPMPGSDVFRIWRRDPEFAELATSAMVGVLNEADEILAMGRSFRNLIRSHIPAGFFLAPNEMDITSAEADDEARFAAGEDNGGEPSLADKYMRMMTEPILDEASMAGVVPPILQGDADILPAVRWLAMERPLDPTLLARHDVLLRRIANGLDLPAAVILGTDSGLNHWCLDEQTQILTQEGWRYHNEVEPGDVALTLNHDTGLSEWQPIDAVNRWDVVDEEMVSIESRCHSSLSTPNHRWPVHARRGRTGKDSKTLRHEREWRTSEELRVTDWIITAAPNADVPTEAKYSDAFVELVAWFWTEGGLRKTTPGRIVPQLTIYQSSKNVENVTRIRAALTALYGPPVDGPLSAGGRGLRDTVPKWRIYMKSNGMVLFRLNGAAALPLVDVAPDRMVSLDFIRQLTQAQLELFIDVSVRGDGHHGAMTVISQKHPAMLAAFELAVILSGRAPASSNVTHQGFREHIQAHMTVQKRTVFGPKPQHTSRTRYTGTIWCPTTSNGSWLAKRRGTVYFTGNSAWQVDEDAFKAHLQPLAILIHSGLWSGWIKPMLRSEGFLLEEINKVTLWHDASALVSHPNRFQDALQAYNLFELSGAALRQTGGFTDEMAPDEVELFSRMARLIATHSRLTDQADPLALAQALMKLGAIEAQGDQSQIVEASDPDAPKADIVIRDYEAPSDVAAKPAAPGGGGGRAEPPGTNVQPQASTVQKGPPPGGPPVRASAQRSRRSNPGTTLAQLDRTLRARLLGEANGAMRRALERAGAKVRGRARNGQFAEQIRDESITNDWVVARLGPNGLKALGFAATELLDEAAFEQFGTTFDQLTARAQAQVRAMLADLGYDNPDDLQPQQDQLRELAWSTLLAGMVALGRDLLYNPSPTAPPQGEFDPTNLVSPGLIRQALAIAGGDESATLDNGAVDSAEPSVPAGGVATGPTAMDAAGDAGYAVTTYEWVHDDPDRDFPPHADLNGTTFESWDDDVLASDGWPDAFYYPGDHDGCLCDAIPVLEAIPADMEQTGENMPTDQTEAA